MSLTSRVLPLFFSYQSYRVLHCDIVHIHLMFCLVNVSIFLYHYLSPKRAASANYEISSHLLNKQQIYNRQSYIYKRQSKTTVHHHHRIWTGAFPSLPSLPNYQIVK